MEKNFMTLSIIRDDFSSIINKHIAIGQEFIFEDTIPLVEGFDDGVTGMRKNSDRTIVLMREDEEWISLDDVSLDTLAHIADVIENKQYSIF